MSGRPDFTAPNAGRGDARDVARDTARTNGQGDGPNGHGDGPLSPALREAVALLRATPDAAPHVVERATAAALAAQRAARVGAATAGRGAHPAWSGRRPVAWAAGVLLAVGMGVGVWSARGSNGQGAAPMVSARAADVPSPTASAAMPALSPNDVPNKAPDARSHAVLGEGSGVVPAALATVGASDEAPQLVRFRLRAPGAHRVAVVGDFNRWDRAATPLARRADAWTADVPLTPGRHAYAFVVDGHRWVLDPAAPEERDPDFGRVRSVTVVGLVGTP